MRGMTLEVAMLADVRGAYSAISSVYQCVTRPFLREHSSFPLDKLDFLVNKMLMAWPLNLHDLLWITSEDVNLSIIMIFYSFY